MERARQGFTTLRHRGVTAQPEMDTFSSEAEDTAEIPNAIKFRKLKLASGGMAIIRYSRIISLTHSPALVENRSDLGLNPYPGRSDIERWTACFEYGNHYEVTKYCFNKLKKELLSESV